MNLSRELIESGFFQQLAAKSTDSGQPVPLSDQELEASMQATLAAKPAADHAWVFGYGSLIWNPLFDFDREEILTLHGYRRRFCLKTKLSRGTPENPGLLLGLVPGGSCRGVAFRLTGPQFEDDLRVLWRREMITGAYAPRWVRLRADGRSLLGLAFVMNRQYPYYVEDLGVAATATVLASAHGPLGSCAEYLIKTHEGLGKYGIVDAHMNELLHRVQAIGKPT